MKLKDVLGVWEGRIGKDRGTVRVERDAIHIECDAWKAPASLTGAAVVERNGEVWFRGERGGEDVSVVVRAHGSGELELRWLDAIFPFGVGLSRPEPVTSAPKVARGPRGVVAAFEALVREAGREVNDDDNPFVPQPRPEPYRAEVARFGAEACPILTDALRSGGSTHRVEAARVLSMIGEAATGEAREALRLAAERHPGQLGPWLFDVDPQAAMDLGLHRSPGSWHGVFTHAIERDAATAGALLAELLDDPRTLAAVLGKEPRHHDPIDRVAKARPDRVPIARLRELRSHADVAVREAATSWLLHLNRPEALEAALIEPRATLLWMAERLAAWPRSDRLFELFAQVDRSVAEEAWLADLVVRRRCAGLSNPTERLLPMLAATFRSARSHFHVTEALRASEALGDPCLGELARTAIERVPGVSLGPHRETLERGDALFGEGRADTGTPYYCAFLAYANALFQRVTAHGAFQLAWIDRAFGTPAHAARVEWIRDLGFRDEELLAQVAQAPRHPLPDRRSAWHPSSVATQLNPRLLALHGAVAEHAGLPGTAAAIFACVEKRTGGHADDRVRCVEATRAHLERVAAACR